MKAPQLLKNDSISLHICLIVVAAVVVWGLTCGLWSLSGDAETTFAGMAKTMLADGHFIPGAAESLEQHAPLALWLSAGVLKIAGGLSSLALRLIAVVFALSTLWCTYLCGRRLLSPKAGLYGAFILATCPVFLLAATKAGPDMVFTGLITLSITAVVTHPPRKRVSILRAVVIWLCLIAAFLTYGPLAVIMVLLFIILFAIAQGKEMAHEFQSLRFFSGILAGVVIVGVWLFLEYHFTGGSFIKQELHRFNTLFSSSIKVAGWWYYFAQIGWILGIWTIGLIIALGMLLTHKAKFIPKWYVWLFWFAPGFIILCVVQVKNTGFILPLLPPLALFTGYYLHALSAKVMNGPLSGFIAVLVGKIIMALGIVLCTACLVVFIQLEFAWAYAFYVSRQGLVVAFIIGLVLIFLGTWNYKTECGLLIGVIMVCLLLGNIGLNSVVRPALDVIRSPKYFSQNLQNMYPELADYSLGVVSSANGPDIAAASLHIYGDYEILPLAFSADMFADNNTPALPDFLLMTRADFDNLALKPQLGGFAPVFWDTVARRFELILLQRQTDSVTSPQTPRPLIYAVPKPLVLAVFGEAYPAATAETPEPQTLVPEEHEAVLKEIYGGSAVITESATEDGGQIPGTPPEALDETAAGTADAVVTPDEQPQAKDSEPADHADATAAPAVEASETQATPVSADAAETEGAPASDAGEVEAASPLQPEATAPPVDTVTVTPTTETDAPGSADEQAQPDAGSANGAPADDGDTPAVLPPTRESDSPRFAPQNGDDADASVPKPQTRQWRPLLTGIAHAETLPPFSFETAEAFMETAAEDEPVPAELPAEDIPADMTAASTVDSGFAQRLPAVVNLNAAQCILPQGLMLLNGALTPYQSNCAGRNAALVGVNTYQPDLVRFFSVNLQSGFKDNAYALHWFKTQAGKFAAEYNMLVINNLPATLAFQAPYTAGFNRWAMAQLKDAVMPQAVFFTGYTPTAGLSADSIFALIQTDAADIFAHSANNVQINFGLTHTTLLLEYDNIAPQIIQLKR